jgi:hypothetical protein
MLQPSWFKLSVWILKELVTYVFEMDNARTTEWIVLMAMFIHLMGVPFTKVEESFNMQALHDIL